MIDDVDVIVTGALAEEFPWPRVRPEVSTKIPETGWGVPDRLLKSNLSPETKLVVELGSFLGDSARYIADHAPNATVICIDHWEGSAEHTDEFKELLPVLYDSFLASCWNYRDRIIPIRANTVDGLRIVSRFGLKPDVIYIDASHDRESVTQDLNVSHTLFPDAVLIEDDYKVFIGVRRAVDRFASEHGLFVQAVGRGWQFVKEDIGLSKVAMKNNSKCCILMSVGSGIERPTEAGLMALKDRGYDVRIKYDVSDINKTRSYLATQALMDGYDELMWIDSDIVFEPDAVDRLRAHDLPFVTGLYCLKRKEGGIASILYPENKVVKFGKNGGLIEIWCAAAGFMYTKREVYEQVRDKCNLPTCDNGDDMGYITPYFFPLIVRDSNAHRYLGEDISFSERVRHSGIKMYADTTIRLGHIGKYWYFWEDMAGDRPRSQDFELEME